MKDFLPVIKNTALFGGISDNEINEMLNCLGVKEERYGKGQYILRVGDSADSVGLFLAGNALIIQEDFWGNRNIIGKIMPSDLFAETFACSTGAILTVAVVAEDDCTVL